MLLESAIDEQRPVRAAKGDDVGTCACDEEKIVTEWARHERLTLVARKGGSYSAYE